MFVYPAAEERNLTTNRKCVCVYNAFAFMMLGCCGWLPGYSCVVAKVVWVVFQCLLLGSGALYQSLLFAIFDISRLR